MKVNVWFIVVQHLKTLCRPGEAGRNSLSCADLVLFYGVPAVVGIVAGVFGVKISEGVYELSVSVFSIFSALLLSVQVAMYGVYRSESGKPSDKILEAEEVQRREQVRLLLREINVNVSYLIVVSCVALTCLLLFFAVDLPCWLESGVAIFIYLHFTLTIAMVLKRVHVVFDGEYDQSAGK